MELTKELNQMLGIETKLSTTFHPQTDGQIERMNQKLEQYLRFFIDHKQKNWPEYLALAEFTINNKVHSATKILLFMVNYGRELKIGIDIRRKEKMKKVMEFEERMKKMQKEAEVILKRTQEKMK